MQIDTWNRDEMELTGSAFVPGPYPKKSGDSKKWPSGSLAPVEGPDASYSGLLECPLTTRITKQMQADATLRMSGKCLYETAFASECFSNAKAALGPGLGSAAHFKTSTGSDSTR